MAGLRAGTMLAVLVVLGAMPLLTTADPPCTRVSLAELGVPHLRAEQAQAASPDLALVDPQVTGDAACEGLIRPGAQLLLDGGHACTANWVFTDAAGALYIGTAGHCIREAGEASVVVEGLGDIGDPVFTTGDAGPGRDFALVRIAPEWWPWVEPTLCRWGGPASLAEPGAAGPEVRFYGWGAGYAETEATRARAGLLAEGAPAPAGAMAYLAPTGPGDSGSPLLDAAGRALGVHTHTSALLDAPIAGLGVKYATVLRDGMGWAAQALGADLALVPGAPPRFPLP